MKKIITFVLVAWCMLSLCYLAGEDIEGTMSFGTFVLHKLIALGSFGLSCYVIKIADSQGMLWTDESEDTEI